MPWGKIDDSLYDHPKLDALGRLRMPCVGLWAVAISWSNRRLTDGHVPRERIRLLGGTIAQAEALADVGLFEREGPDYLIHDFTDFNENRVTVLSRRTAAAERQRRSRESREQSHGESQVMSQRDKGVSHAIPPGARDRGVPASPDRIQTTENPPPPAERGRRDKGTNLRANGEAPRQVGDNPRANGASPRQEREAEKRGPSKLGDVLRESVRRQASQAEVPEWMAEPEPSEAKR